MGVVIRVVSAPQPAAPYELAVVAIFRNEAHVLAEWLDHYRTFGVEHFYLINNNSTDAYLSVLEPYLRIGLIDLFDCAEDGYQIGAYTELLPLLKAEAHWVGVFDLDEFVYPAGGGQFLDVINRFADSDAVLVPWLSFGSNGHVTQPASVVDHFVRRGHAGVSRSFLKAFSKPSEIVYFSQHNPVTRNSRKVLSNSKPIGDELFIEISEEDVVGFSLINNHYRLQSLEYFEGVKSSRPEVNEEVRGRFKELSFFHQYDRAWSEVLDCKLADIRRTRNIGEPQRRPTVTPRQ